MGVSPYFGGGIGVGFVDTAAAMLTVFDFDDFTGLAWQVGAGIRFNFVSNLGFDIGYRYRNVTNVGMGTRDDVDFASNNFVVGLTFNF